jgi:hypothetical protein
MDFRTILVPIEEHDFMNSTLETALFLARKFDSYIEGFALRVAFPAAYTVAIPQVEQDIAENAQRSQSLFENFMQEQGVPRAGPAIGLSSSWLEDAPGGDRFVGSHGRLFDVIVLGRPGLRARRERPRGCAAEQRDELATFHSITSSARASSVDGTSRPSALAVLRLMISSNVLDCITGRSTGFAPLRILAA